MGDALEVVEGVVFLDVLVAHEVEETKETPHEHVGGEVDLVRLVSLGVHDVSAAVSELGFVAALELSLQLLLGDD